jgi:hypothetical protein
VGTLAGDGLAGLAVGAFGETVNGQAFAGAVTIFPGSTGGVRTPGRTFIQGVGGIGGTAEAFDAFGAALGQGWGRGWLAGGSLAG